MTFYYKNVGLILDERGNFVVKFTKRKTRNFLISIGLKKLKIYVGCSLTHAPYEFRKAVENLKQALRMKYEVLEFLGLVNGTPKDVYEWDLKECVAECDFFLAICDHPSLGLGYELATAIEKLHKPVLGVAHRDAHVTRLILGITQTNFIFRRYFELEEVANFVDEEIRKFVAITR